MAFDIEELFGKIKQPVRSVTICLNADLQAEHDELTEKLNRAQSQPGRKLDDGGEARDIARRIAEIEDVMRGSEVTFRFKGIPAMAFEAIKERYPVEGKPGQWDVYAGCHALLAACSYEPKMTEAQAKRLVDEISNGQLDRLFTAALVATTGDSRVPFSVRASELLGEHA